MTPIAAGLVGIVALLVLLAIRVPIGFSLIFVSFCGIWYLRSFDTAWSQLGIVPHEFSASWTLSAIPMFILMGAIAHHSGITTRLFQAARLWLGSLPGGLAVATSAASAGFAAASGSSIAMAAAMSKIAVPEMLKAGYRQSLATATVAAAGTIGSMIPPSILFILFGWYTETPIGQLFIAGIVPGLLTALLYMIMIVTRCKLDPSLAPPLAEKPAMTEKVDALLKIWPLPLLIFIVIFGLYSGLTSATEAGAFGAFGALLIAVSMRQLSWKQFFASLIETVKSVATILFIAIGAVLLTRFMTMSGLPNAVASVMADSNISELSVIIFMAIIYIVLGMFLDPLGIILITLPILQPMFEAVGMNMIWVGVMVVKLVEIGLITPPIGLNAFIVKSSLGDQIELSQIFRGLTWFIALELGVFILLASYPQLSLYLPSLMAQ
ncbi:MAG: TRAP transporter large permease [Burkholderiaceae bacterium]